MDDTDCVCETIEIIGCAIISTLNNLEKDGLWDAVPNLGLILSMFIYWIPNFADAMSMNDQNWLPELVAYAEKHNMQIQGVYDIQKDVSPYPSDDVEDEKLKKIKRAPSNDKYGFKQMVGVVW